MGKITFTPLQQLVLNKFAKEKNLKDNFYLTGGTVLSLFYLKHRYSEDLDFFSEKEFNQNQVVRFINKISRKLGIHARFTKKEMVMFFYLKKGKEEIKIDFIHYPYFRIEKGLNYRGISVDSLIDIAVNKLLIINLQATVKDYVDLFFLLKEKFTIWDLLYAVEKKFCLEMDLISLGKDFIVAEKFDYLPKMIKPLELKELKRFFKEKAKEIGKKAIK